MPLLKDTTQESLKVSLVSGSMINGASVSYGEMEMPMK